MRLKDLFKKSSKQSKKDRDWHLDYINKKWIGFGVYGTPEDKAKTLFIRQVVKTLADKGLEVQSGHSRIVFINKGKYVYKVPLGTPGIDQNYLEAEMFKNNVDNVIKVARCKILDIGKKVGVPILLMEAVSMDLKQKSYLDFPEWVWQVDGAQVGVTRKGDLVAYDV